MIELANHQELVFTRRGRVAHIGTSWLSGGLETNCGYYGSRSHWLGLGTQGEYEKARALPLCKRCQK